MEDPDLLLLPDLMEDADDMEDIDCDYTPEDIAPYTSVFIPYLSEGNSTFLISPTKLRTLWGQKQLSLSVSQTSTNVCGALLKEMLPTIEDKTFPFPHLAGIFSRLLIHKYDAICSPIKRHAIIRMIFFMNLSSLDDDELVKLQTHFILFLLNATSNSNKEGYNTIEEFATVDTYDEEVAWAFGLPVPASRASIAALPSQVFNDEGFSNRCSICLDEYSSGATQLPCLHDFHRECIERWLNMSYSCPTCRLPI